jgi:benzoyl-CoA reductase subunit B
MNSIHSAVKKLSIEYIHHGDTLGFDQDICGYVRNDMGLMGGPAKGKSPFGTIPPPDLLVLNQTGCFTYAKWFESLARMYGCPLVMLDIPYTRNEELNASDKKYIAGQIEDLIKVLEEVSGKKFDIDILIESLGHTRDAIDLYLKLLDIPKARPTPVDGYFEITSFMGPITVSRGTVDCVDYYRETIEGIEKRASEGRSPFGDENFRLVFDGPPPWPSLKEFREMFHKHGAVGVAGTYSRVTCDYEGMETDASQPFDFLVDLASRSYFNWNIEKRRNFIHKLAKEFDADGIVFHSVKSCKPYSIGMLDSRNYFASQTSIPVLFLDSDIADPRFFSNSQIRERVDTFMESVASRNLRMKSTG